jgi:hypothetical protein
MAHARRRWPPLISTAPNCATMAASVGDRGNKRAIESIPDDRAQSPAAVRRDPFGGSVADRIASEEEGRQSRGVRCLGPRARFGIDAVRN